MTNHPNRSKQQPTSGQFDLAATALEATVERDRLKELNAELLAALKFFVETDDVETALEKARAAIAKACKD